MGIQRGVDFSKLFLNNFGKLHLTYEHMVEELHGPIDLPWTITALTSNQNKAVFQDLSQERPSDAQWEEAPTEEEEERGVMLRRRSKGPEIRGQKREVASAQKPSEPFSSARGSKERKRENLAREPCAFFAAEENRKGVEIEWALPTSRRGIKKFINNPEAYVCTQLKRKTSRSSRKTTYSIRGS